MHIARVIAFSCGTFAALRGLVFAGEPLLSAAIPLRHPFLCFAIELSDGSCVLVDTGQDRSLSAGLGARTESFLARWGVTSVPPAAYFTAHLRALGITRDRVRAAVLTHLDYDHTGGVRALAGAPVYVDPVDWSWATAGGLRERLSGRVRTQEFAATMERREPQFARAADVPMEGGVFPVPEAKGLVRVVSLPGHTPGHAGVLVSLGEGRPRLLLSGDACMASEHVTERAAPGPLMLAFAIDRPRLLSTLEALRRWRAQEPSLRIVPSHDPTVGARCEEGPAVLYDRSWEQVAATS